MSTWQDKPKLNAADYDIDPEFGFLSIKCEPLPSCYDQWAKLCSDLPSLTHDELKLAINDLPEFPLDKLTNDQLMLRTAYAVLSFLIHAYVWKKGENDPQLIIPKQLAVPYIEVSKRLGIAPILTHAAVDLYNWRLKDNNSSFSLENLEINHSFTNYPDEAWFYKIHIMMEKIGGSALMRVIELANLCLQHESTDEMIINLLEELKGYIKDISNTISRMNEGCNPKIFFDLFRPYLNGWKNEEHFPNGILYEGVGYLKYGGGSAAQSSLIQALDRILGVEHLDDYSKSFLADMLAYMPEKHRNFLQILTTYNIKPYIVNNCSSAVIEVYNSSLKSLEELRKIHMGLARQYVLKQIENRLKGSNASEEAIGTGGTEIKRFLNATIQQTRNTQI